MTAIPLNVNGKMVMTVDVTYDDLVWLYQDYINKNGKVPTTNMCLSKNNLPQERIVKRVLAENNITYKDFLLQFGKVKKVRTSNPDDYDMFVEKFISVCNSIGRTLRMNELFCNHYGLPNSQWFIKYCPDKSVTTYKQFLSYCGLEQNKHIWTKEEAAKVLIEYENKVGRPIITEDLCVDKVGISAIVINRLFGGLSKAKEELCLMKTLPNQPKPFEYYKGILTDTLLDYKSKTGNPYITWGIIESGMYGKEKINHKPMIKSFNDNEVDLYAYVRSFDLKFNPSLFSNTYTFEDGERADSNYEYAFSTYLRSIGLKYKQDYLRTVKYNTFHQEKSKMTCDYLIQIKNTEIYIEVAGLISNFENEDWKTHDYINKVTNSYRDKMIYKEQIFKQHGLNYMFIFANEMKDGSYKDKLSEILQLPLQMVA